MNSMYRKRDSNGNLPDLEDRCYAHKTELNPTEKQKVLLRSAVGATRFAQNWAVGFVKQQMDLNVKQSWSSISLHTAWREHRTIVAPWYTEQSKETFQYGCERAAQGLSNWKASKKGVRKGKKMGFVKFRKKNHNDSVAYTKFSIRPDGLTVRIPRIGWVRLKEQIILPEGVRTPTIVVRPKAGRWFITFKLREDNWVEPTKTPILKTVGVDLGISNRLATMSDGTILDNPRFFRQQENKLRRAQRKVSRRVKGSANRRKAVEQVQKIFYETTCKRSDYIHKFTTDLVKNHDEIVIEDLNVEGMKRSLRLGKSVSDACLAEIRRQLAYKTSWTGKTLTVVSRWFPSSKLCSECGEINDRLVLSDREWSCCCGVVHDRDLNAARNLAASSAVSVCGGNVRLNVSLAVTGEAESFIETERQQGTR